MDIEAFLGDEGLKLQTPCLVLDFDVMERNIDAMADSMRERGIDLRPHFKTHKSIEVAKRQRDAGVVGFTCATLDEAELLANNGFDDIFIALPVVARDEAGERIADLSDEVHLRVAVDSVDAVKELAALQTKNRIHVMLEIDSGLHRSGLPPSAVVPVAQAARANNLVVDGVFTYPGHAYSSRQAPRKAVADEERALGVAVRRLRKAGFAAKVVSGGSTPTAPLARGSSIITEQRPGVYVFNDSQQIKLGTCKEADVAIFVVAQVSSNAAQRGQFIIDAGSKALNTDKLAWIRTFGAIVGKSDFDISRLHEHHGTVTLPPRTRRPEVGTLFAVIPNHVCNTVNLFSDYAVVKDGKVRGYWPIQARSANTPHLHKSAAGLSISA